MPDNGFTRILGVLISPEATFRQIGERPTWAVILVVLVLAGLGANLVAIPKVDFEAETIEAVQRSGRTLSDDEMAQAVEVQKKFGPTFALVSSVVLAPLAYLLTALMFWVALKMLGSDLAFREGFSVTLHGLVPGALISTLLTVVVALGRDTLRSVELRQGIVATHAGFFAPDDASQRLLTFLSSLDLLTFWSLGLLALGFAIVGRIDRVRAASAVLGVWVVYVAAKVGIAGVFG